MTEPKLPNYKTKQLLGKAVNPSIFLTLIASVGNVYVEFQDMQKTMSEQKTQIHDLQLAKTSKDEDIKELVDSLRDRLREDSRTTWELRLAITSIQAEMRVRTHRGSNARLDDIEEETNTIMQRVENLPAPVTEPLSGLKF